MLGIAESGGFDSFSVVLWGLPWLVVLGINSTIGLVGRRSNSGDWPRWSASGYVICADLAIMAAASMGLYAAHMAGEQGCFVESAMKLLLGAGLATACLALWIPLAVRAAEGQKNRVVWACSMGVTTLFLAAVLIAARGVYIWDTESFNCGV